MKKKNKSEVQIERVETFDPLPDMFYVCSHGASVKRPVLVSEKDAEWLKSSGVTVYSREEYIKVRNS